jgi:hypothetical protein
MPGPRTVADVLAMRLRGHGVASVVTSRDHPRADIMTIDDVGHTEFELPHPIWHLTTRFQVAAGLVGRAVCS